MPNLSPNEQAIIDLLWDYLKRDPEFKDRRQTGWGTKTKTGVIACVIRAVTDEPSQLPAREGNHDAS